jgi:hypothetical protein
MPDGVTQKAGTSREMPSGLLVSARRAERTKNVRALRRFGRLSSVDGGRVDNLGVPVGVPLL